MRTGRLGNDGRLQMLAVKGRPNVDLAASPAAPGATYRVEWVDIDDPAPTFPYTPGPAGADHQRRRRSRYVGNQGRAQGAAYFSRLEGAAYDDGVVYFTSTQGGGPAETGPGPIADGYGNGHGQVWAYHTRAQRAAAASTSRPGRTCSTSRTTSPPARAARWSSARTTSTTTTCAG